MLSGLFVLRVCSRIVDPPLRGATARKYSDSQRASRSKLSRSASLERAALSSLRSCVLWARLRQGRVDCRYHASPIERKKLGSVVLKTHLRGNKWLKKMHMQGNIHVFSSGDTDLYGHVNQQKKDLIECATCQVERYRCLFQLSDHEVTVVKTFITMWGTLRKCCGSQMSKYERLRLHKCDIRSYVNRTNYPHCEKLDLERLERRFLAIPLPFDRQGFYPGKVGDCRRSREEIVKGKDFNGRKFQGCRRSKEEEAKVEEGARRGL